MNKSWRSKPSRKTKYKYDIEVIESMFNMGCSIRFIARRHGWCERSTQNWINRNFDKHTKFVRKSNS
jgi:hypothetical protein